MSMLKKWQEVGLARAQIKIRYIKNGVLALSDRRYRVVLKTSAVNFGLKSEEEQNTLINNFKTVLNGISAPIQILIRTRKMDVGRYLKRLEKCEKEEPNVVYKQQLKLYRDFIRQKVETSRILSRRFYVIVSCDTQLQQEELAIAMKEHIPRDRREYIRQYRLTEEEIEEDMEFSLAKQQLEQLSNNLIGELERVGIRAERLSNEELLDLFYSSFNPGAAIGKPLRQRLKDEEVEVKLQVT